MPVRAQLRPTSETPGPRNAEWWMHVCCMVDLMLCLIIMCVCVVCVCVCVCVMSAGCWQCCGCCMSAACVSLASGQPVENYVRHLVHGLPREGVLLLLGPLRRRLVCPAAASPLACPAVSIPETSKDTRNGRAIQSSPLQG